jgi:hypothetical protein
MWATGIRTCVGAIDSFTIRWVGSDDEAIISKMRDHTELAHRVMAGGYEEWVFWDRIDRDYLARSDK